MNKVRAKAFVSCGEFVPGVGKQVNLTGVYGGTAPDGGNACEENRMFGNATPHFSLSMTIANEAAAAQFTSGSHVYVDFSRAD